MLGLYIVIVNKKKRNPHLEYFETNLNKNWTNYSKFNK